MGPTARRVLNAHFSHLNIFLKESYASNQCPSLEKLTVKAGKHLESPDPRESKDTSKQLVYTAPYIRSPKSGVVVYRNSRMSHRMSNGHWWQLAGHSYKYNLFET